MEAESRAYLLDRQTDILDSATQSSDLVELMGRDRKLLTQTDQDRLRLFGIRVLLGQQYQYGEVKLGLHDETELLRGQRAVYHRPRLNYGIPLAWETFKERANPEFVQWFEENVIPE